MNVKDKAIEISKKFKGFEMPNEEIASIQCAIIHVKGIIEVLDIFPRYQMTSFEIERLDYWKQVLTILKEM